MLLNLRHELYALSASKCIYSFCNLPADSPRVLVVPCLPEQCTCPLGFHLYYSIYLSLVVYFRSGVDCHGAQRVQVVVANRAAMDRFLKQMHALSISAL